MTQQEADEEFEGEEQAGEEDAAAAAAGAAGEACGGRKEGEAGGSANASAKAETHGASVSGEQLAPDAAAQSGRKGGRGRKKAAGAAAEAGEAGPAPAPPQPPAGGSAAPVLVRPPLLPLPPGVRIPWPFPAAAWGQLAAIMAARPGLLRPPLLPGQQPAGPAGAGALVRLPLPPGFPFAATPASLPQSAAVLQAAALGAGAGATVPPRPAPGPQFPPLLPGLNLPPGALPAFLPFLPPTPLGRPPGLVLPAGSPSVATAGASASVQGPLAPPATLGQPAAAAAAPAPAPPPKARGAAAPARAAPLAAEQPGSCATERALGQAGNGPQAAAEGPVAAAAPGAAAAPAAPAEDEIHAARCAEGIPSGADGGGSGASGDGSPASRKRKKEGAAQPPAPALPDPLPPAAEVVCEATLKQLIALPPRNITLDREEGGDSGQVGAGRAGGSEVVVHTTSCVVAAAAAASCVLAAGACACQWEQGGECGPVR